MGRHDPDAILWWANYAYGRGYHNVTSKDSIDTQDEIERAHGIEGCPWPARLPITRAAFKDQMNAGKRHAIREAP